MIPVIFANGKDDDTLGLAAAFRNETVLFDEKEIKPFEDIVLYKRTIILTRPILVLGPNAKDGTEGQYDKYGGEWLRTYCPHPSREVSIKKCFVRCTWMPVGSQEHIEDVTPDNAPIRSEDYED